MRNPNEQPADFYYGDMKMGETRTFKYGEEVDQVAKLHYIYDEALKVEREYEEVNADIEANVGDYVYVTDSRHIHRLGKVEVKDNSGVSIDAGNSVVYYPYVFSDEYVKLAPTGNVRLSDGQCYRLAERKAAVGERIISLTNDPCRFPGFSKGDVFTAESVGDPSQYLSSMHDIGFTDNNGVDCRAFHSNNDYRVLEPVESAEPAPQAPPKDTADLLANLVRRVAELESQNHANSKEIHNLARENESILEKYEALTKEMASIRRDLQTFAEVAETAKHTAEQNRSKPKEVARKVIDDINEYYAKGGCV